MSSEVGMGFADVDITPADPVYLWGQYYPRVSNSIHSQLKAVAWAVKSGDQQVIFVTVDILGIPKSFLDELRVLVADTIMGFDVNNLIVNAIHTHSGPLIQEYPLWPQVNDEVKPAGEFREFLLGSLVEVITDCWSGIQPGKISYTNGYAEIGHNRRVCYTDGTVEMYGETDRDDFAGFEGCVDNKVNVLWCWDENDKLSGIVLNFACPAQVLEATYKISSDFVGEARRLIKAEFGEDVEVLCQIGMAGDVSPHDLTDKNPVELWGEKGVEILGARLAQTVIDTFKSAGDSVYIPGEFIHNVIDISIPVARVTYEEYIEAVNKLKILESAEPQSESDASSARSRYYAYIKHNEDTPGRSGPYDTKKHDFVYMRDYEAVIKRYKSQNSESLYSFEVHIIRLGEIAFATNPFEICIDFSHQLRARGKSRRIFSVQLACDVGGYVPTARTVYGDGGYRGYGALIINGKIDASGGKQLIDLTVAEINKLWI